MLIPAAYPLATVEPILLEKLPALARQLPAIQDGPHYRGVVASNNVGTTLRFTATCIERDRSQLTRDMGRAIRLLLERELGLVASPAPAGPPAQADGAPAESTAADADGKPADRPEESPAAAAAK